MKYKYILKYYYYVFYIIIILYLSVINVFIYYNEKY